jgi:hypothetical protein
MINITDDYTHELRGVLMLSLRQWLGATIDNLSCIMDEKISLEEIELFEEGSLIHNNVWFYNEYLNALKVYSSEIGINFNGLTYDFFDEELNEMIVL